MAKVLCFVNTCRCTFFFNAPLHPSVVRGTGSLCSHKVDEFSTEVNLALLYVYAKTANHDKARQLYSLIMNQKSINNSHSKAKDIFRG